MIGTGTAILGAGLLGLGGSIFSANAAHSAANAQLQATQQAQAISQQNAERGVNALQNYSAAAIPFLYGANGDIRNDLAGARDALTNARTAGAFDTNRGADLAGSYADTGYNGARLAIEGGRDTANNYLQPYATTGNAALGTINSLYGPNGYSPTAAATFQNSPDYQFALQGGQRALDFSNAAKGLLQSRGHLNDTVAFGQGLASQQFGNYTNRLMSLAQLGFGANSAMSNNTTSAANALAGISTNRGLTLGGIESGRGQALANMDLGYGNALAGLQTTMANYNYGLGNALANNMFNTGQGIANAYNGQATQQANLALAGGQAAASGIVGGANAINTGFSNFGNQLALYGLLNRGVGGPAGAGAVGGSAPVASALPGSWASSPTTLYNGAGAALTY